MKTRFVLLALACVLVAMPATAQVNYLYNSGVPGVMVIGSPNASGDIVIASTDAGSPVVWINGSAFSGCTNLTSVAIPSSVTVIQSPVFSGCRRLMNITVDAANPAFGSLDGVLFNKAQTTLIAFPPGRGSYVIPSSVTSIGPSAFVNCTALTNVTIPDSVTSIGPAAFAGCTSLTNVTIPNGVTGIGSRAFSGCTGLTNITIPNSVISIEGSTYSGCTNLTSVTIGNSVTSLGYLPFDGCKSLTNFSLAAANPAYSSIDGVWFNKAQTTLGLFPPGRSGSYVIPNSVTNIGDRAFYDCTSVTSVTIPNGVISIGNQAFFGCTNLTSVTIPDRVTQIGTTLHAGGGRAFASCTSLTNVIIGHSVTNIGSGAFYACSNLTRLTIPASVINLGYAAFFGSSRLTNFTFLGNPPRLIFDMNGGFAQFQDVGAGAKVYYSCGTTGWGASYGPLPTVMVCPPGIAPGGAGVKPGGFGFTVTRLTNQAIVIEASVNLVNWQPISTNPPPGPSADFVDPAWLQHPARFYRARSE